VDVRQRFLAGVARQLGHPQGLAGRLVGARLNRGNARAVAAAVDAAGVGAGASAADLGFGGGVGLSLLLERVGASGIVHGVEVSDEMLATARRRHPAAISTGRLVLHKGSLDRLPLPEAALDGLVTTNTVYFIDDLPAAFAEMARVLAPSGRAVLGIGDPDAMARMPFTRYGFRLRAVDDVLESARAAGLDLRSHERVGDGSRPFHVLTLGAATPRTA
jgi:arsenite methyltransferase